MLRDDPIFLACWHVIHAMGWPSFTFHHVTRLYPEWTIQDLEIRFPSKHHRVLSFSKSIDPVCGDFSSIQEGLFDAVLRRIDGIVPYRSIIAPSFLEMPPLMAGITSIILFKWFMVYWSSIQFNDNTPPIGLNQLSIMTLSLYRMILPYALTHDYDDTLARLDRWIHFMGTVAKPWPPEWPQR